MTVQQEKPELDMDATMAGLVVASILFVIGLVLLVFWRRRGTSGQTVLLTGLTDAGKTLLFARLTSGNVVQTYTSQTENFFSLENGISLVDVPGAVNVRSQRFRHWLKANSGQLKGVIVVVDSVTFPKQSRDVAELLYEVLVDVPSNAQVLVACNKHDMPTAKSVQIIEQTLEKELTLLGGTRSATLEQTDGSESSTKRQLPLPFKWDDFDAVQVEFVECSARGTENEEEAEGEEGEMSDVESNDIGPIDDWIAAL